VQEACASVPHLDVSGVVYNTERGEELNIQVQRIHWEIRLKDDE